MSKINTNKKSTNRYWIIILIILIIIFKIITAKPPYTQISKEDEKNFTKNSKYFEKVAEMYLKNYQENNFEGRQFYPIYNITDTNIVSLEEYNFSSETLNDNKINIQKVIDNYPCEKGLERIYVYENGIVAFDNINGVEMIAYIPKGEKSNKNLKRLIDDDADGIYTNKLSPEWYYISAKYYLFF